MITSYFKTGLRNILKNKASNAINMVGLTLGISSAILIFAYVSYEIQYDQFHKDTDRIFQLTRETTDLAGNSNHTPGSQLAFQKALIEEWKDPEYFVPVYGSLSPLVTILPEFSSVLNGSEVKFLEDEEGIATTSDFFRVFNFPWLTGTPEELDAPNTIALSEDYAIKYFGSVQGAMGRSVMLNNKFTVKVVGVLKNIPPNTHFPMNIVLSYENKKKDFADWGFAAFDDWGSVSSNDLLYVKLPPNYTIPQADRFFAGFIERHKEQLGDRGKIVQSIMPFEDLHFNPYYSSLNGQTVSKTKLWGITIVGFLIILMACINFINLATALMNARMKEVGVRKALGGGKMQIALQFLSETFLIGLFASLVGLFVAYATKPLLTNAFGFPEDFALTDNPALLPFIGGVLIMVTLLAGIYPSLVMGNFSPLEAFRDKQKGKWQKGFSLRKALIVFQFTVAIFLILCTLINVSQMEMIANRDMGFKKEGVVFFQIDPEKSAGFESFRNRLQQIKDVESVSFNSDNPSSQNNWSSNFAFDHRGEDEAYGVFLKFGDGDFFKTYGLQMLAGAPYTNMDTARKYVINETLMRKLGIEDPKEVIGKDLRLGGRNWGNITGVVKDFHSNTAREENNPIALASRPEFFWQCAVKLSSNNVVRSMEELRKAYSEFYPENYFSGTFYEDYIQEFYTAEVQLGSLYRIASGIAILIACLGLLGLAALMTEQRKKEIGVRKVMGAGLMNILTLVSKDFILLVGISALIGLPAAWYFSDKWLQSFVFRIDISWQYFAVTIIAAFLISMLSVSYHALRAALLNPVKSLKSE
ncbi:MAG: ABC transporter permease [Saprospiraceae bacterium]|nr:ABC transporter permease [Saprospiraceae bacterium]